MGDKVLIVVEEEEVGEQEMQEQEMQEQNVREQADVSQEDVPQQEKEEGRETYATRHRRRTRRSMQKYPSSPELGEGCGGRSSRKFRCL